MEGKHIYEGYHPHHYEGYHPHHWGISHSPLTFISKGLELPAQAIHFGLGVVAKAAGIVEHLAWQCIHPLHLGGHYPHHYYPVRKERHAHYPFWEKPHATTDIQVRTRLGETRIVTFLVENNRSHQAQITFSASPFIDAHGNQTDGSLVHFVPDSVTLEPGEAQRVTATFTIQAPLTAGRAYFTEFILTGCPAKPISVAVWVLPENVNDFYALCDQCRRRRGHFVEFCHYPYDRHGYRHYGYHGSHGWHGYRHCGCHGSHGWHGYRHCGCHGPWRAHGYWLKQWPCHWTYLGTPVGTFVAQGEYDAGGTA